MEKSGFGEHAALAELMVCNVFATLFITQSVSGQQFVLNRASVNRTVLLVVSLVAVFSLAE